MYCTPEQIEEKRKLAQMKLHAKYKSDSSPRGNRQILNQSTKNGGSPLKQYHFNPYDKRKATLPFYVKTDVITVSSQLISEDRFVVNLSAFDTSVINVFRTIPSRLYDMETRTWNFHINDHSLLQNKLNKLQPNVIFTNLPTYILNLCKTPKSDYSQIDLSRIDGELFNALMPFQQEGVCFGIDKKGRCLIADDMGLGKTFQALAIADYYRSDWPLLVVTTSSMKNIWEETIHKHVPSISVMETQYMVSGKDYIGDAKILIVSYDMMTRCVDKLSARKFGVIVIDESHTLKNFKAKCTKSAIVLTKKAKRVILLSGTPVLSRPCELYTQLCLIDDKFFGSFFDYSRRYCDGRNTQFGWDASGKSNLQELEIILAKKFMIRRTKEDVLKSLPNKVQEVVSLDVKLNQLCEEDRNYFNALAEKYMNEKGGSEKHSALITFFSETSKIKIPSVCSYILQVLEQKNKFLVFAHHKKMLDAIQKVVMSKKIQFVRIDGSTTSEQRKHFVDKFQLDDNCMCAILSITAACAGITLTAAQVVLFAELHWNPSILSQAESRAHRIGQERNVVVKYLLALGTADDPIWALLKKKQKILNEIGLSKGSFDNMSVTSHNFAHSKALPENLNHSITDYHTLDITTFFKYSEKKTETDDNVQNLEVSCTDVTELFNDDLDEVLSSVIIDC